jgi:hypothetical protein
MHYCGMFLQKETKSIDQFIVEGNVRLHKFVVARIAIKIVRKGPYVSKNS